MGVSDYAGTITRVLGSQTSRGRATFVRPSAHCREVCARPPRSFAVFLVEIHCTQQGGIYVPSWSAEAGAKGGKDHVKWLDPKGRSQRAFCAADSRGGGVVIAIEG